MNAEEQPITDNVVAALVANAQTTLDLIWALRWIEVLIAELCKDGDVGVADDFIRHLRNRTLSSDALKACAEEVGL